MPFIENYEATVSDQAFEQLYGLNYEKTILTSLHARRKMDELLIIPNTKLFLFVGPEGYGKHSLANALSNYLYDYDYEYFYVDCDELVEEGKEATAIHGIFSDVFHFTAARETEDGERIDSRKFYIVLDEFDKICHNKKVCKLLKKSFECLESDYSEYDCECIVVAIAERPEDVPAKLRQHMNVLRLELPSEEDRKQFFEAEFTFYLDMEDSKEEGFLPYASEAGARAMAEMTEGLSYAELRKVILQSKLYYRQQVANAKMDFELYSAYVKDEQIGFLKEDDVKEIVNHVLGGRAIQKAEVSGTAAMPQIVYVGAPAGMPTTNIETSPVFPRYKTNPQDVDDPDVVNLHLYNTIKEEHDEQTYQDDLYEAHY